MKSNTHVYLNQNLGDQFCGTAGWDCICEDITFAPSLTPGPTSVPAWSDVVLIQDATTCLESTGRALDVDACARCAKMFDIIHYEFCLLTLHEVVTRFLHRGFSPDHITHHADHITCLTIVLLLTGA